MHRVRNIYRTSPLPCQARRGNSFWQPFSHFFDSFFCLCSSLLLRCSISLCHFLSLSQLKPRFSHGHLGDRWGLRSPLYQERKQGEAPLFPLCFRRQYFSQSEERRAFRFPASVYQHRSSVSGGVPDGDRFFSCVCVRDV